MKLINKLYDHKNEWNNETAYKGQKIIRIASPVETPDMTSREPIYEYDRECPVGTKATVLQVSPKYSRISVIDEFNHEWSFASIHWQEWVIV
jgi:hypothetical protein